MDFFKNSIFLIRSTLKTKINHDWINFKEIKKRYEINLDYQDDILKHLQQSEDIILDTEFQRLKFKPKYPVYNIADLANQLNLHPNGIKVADLLDIGVHNIELIVNDAIANGVVLSIYDKYSVGSASNIVLFPSNFFFLVPLTCTVSTNTHNYVSKDNKTMWSAKEIFSLSPHCTSLYTSDNITNEVNRGDMLVIGKKGVSLLLKKQFTLCTRISLEKKEIYIHSQNPDFVMQNEIMNISKTRLRQQIKNLSRLPTPYSRSSTETKGGDYLRIFNSKKLPIEPAVKTSAFTHKTIFKHGCTNDIKALWRSVTDQHKYRQGDKNLDEDLLKHDIVDAKWLQLGYNKRTAPVKQQKNKKKRRFKYSKKCTNASLFSNEY